MATTKRKRTVATAKSRSATPSARGKAKKAPAKPVRKLVSLKARISKARLLAELADQTALSRKQVASVLEELEVVIARSLKSGSVGEFVWPGMFKAVTVRKKATKARKGINPFTGEPTVFKAKPATRTVRIRPLKKIKEYAVTK